MKKSFLIPILGLGALITSCSPKKHIQKTEETPEVTEVLVEKETPKPPVVRPHYNPSETRKSDILHTELHVSFDWLNRQMEGTEILTVKPYFYETDSLILDAKAMDVHSVVLNGSNEKLIYSNDGSFLRIKLPREYTRNEQYKITIKYTANPEKVEQTGSSAISEAKGLYFINYDGSDPKKHQEIWTQGETEASSVWFPTIDNPTEKTTHDIFITVQDKYTTLSNGYLADSKKEGTKRTDHWIMDKPNSTYLFMMAIGEFSIVKDTWKRKDGSEMEVNYYVEKKYEPHARAIFGETPKMITYFSDLLGVEYPWVKYSQIVVRDYVSGAMENTTATIHGDFLYQTKREIIDGGNESIIAHELFHHWFGDLVTCESWANLPLNESFANYSQFLWDEHKYGEMEADMNAFGEMEGYFISAQQGGHVDMIRYDYKNKEDMFDGHSYNKGGRILNMLRTYVGDEAFFESLKVYLTDNAYKNTEIADLREAFEEVTGEDLNWFFNQWFLASGHPILRFEQQYDSINKAVTVTIIQKQDFEKVPLYKLPIAIDIYTKKGVRREMVWADEEIETIVLNNVESKPYLVNIDATKTLLAKKVDKKSTQQWIYQLNNAPLWLDKKEAFDKIGSSSDENAIQAVIKALDHPFWNVKKMAMQKLKRAVEAHPNAVKIKLGNIAVNGENPKERAAAIKYLSKYYSDDKDLEVLYEKMTKDSSYNVLASAIAALNESNPSKGMSLAKEFEAVKSAKINQIVANIYAENGSEKEHEFFIKNISELSAMNKYGFLQSYNSYLNRQNNKTKAESIAVFEDIAKNESMWFVKLSGYQSLMKLQKDFEKEQKTIATKIESLQLENKTMEIATEEKEFNFCKAQSNKIKTILTKLKAEETDSKVKKYLGIR